MCPAWFNMRLNLAGFLFEHYIKIIKSYLIGYAQINGGFHDPIL